MAVSMVRFWCAFRSYLIYSLYIIVDSRWHVEELSGMDERDDSDGSEPSNGGSVGGRAGVFSGGYATIGVSNLVD